MMRQEFDIESMILRIMKLALKDIEQKKAELNCSIDKASDAVLKEREDK